MLFSKKKKGVRLQIIKDSDYKLSFIMINWDC